MSEKLIALPGDGDGTRTLSSAGTNNYFYLAKDQQPIHYTPESDIVVPTPEEDSIVTHPTLSDDLVAYYKFDGDANDSVGSNNGTVNGATQTSSGKINQGYNFTTLTNVITLGTGLDSIGNASFSTTAWVKTTASNGRIVVQDNVNVNGGWAMGLDSNNLYSFYRGASPVISTASSINDDNWHFVCLTRNPTTGNRKLYIDGVLSNTLTGDTYVTTRGGGTSIGNEYSSSSEYPGTGFIGIIDEVGIWERELTASEVSDLYNSGDGLKYD